jgi:hypothetical protein
MHFLHQKEIMIESSFWNINWNDVVCLCSNVRCELGAWVVLQLIPCSVERSYVHATDGMNKPFCILSTRRLVSPNPFGSQIPCRCWPTSQVWTRMGCTIPIKRRASKEEMRDKLGDVCVNRSVMRGVAESSVNEQNRVDQEQKYHLVQSGHSIHSRILEIISHTRFYNKNNPQHVL